MRGKIMPKCKMGALNQIVKGITPKKRYSP